MKKTSKSIIYFQLKRFITVVMEYVHTDISFSCSMCAFQNVTIGRSQELYHFYVDIDWFPHNRYNALTKNTTVNEVRLLLLERRVGKSILQCTIVAVFCC